jgi:hypothetical protein
MTDILSDNRFQEGHDAAHRANDKNTHPTHACGEHFCGFAAMLIASRYPRNLGTGAIAPFLAMADRISVGAAS